MCSSDLPKKENWQHAIQEEYEAMIRNNALDVTEAKAPAEAISSKWVFKRKRKPDGSIRYNVTHWEARHPLEARQDPRSRWRYLFSKYLTASAAYRVTNTIKKKRTTVRINLCALGQLFYLYLGGDN